MPDDSDVHHVRRWRRRFWAWCGARRFGAVAYGGDRPPAGL